MTLKHRFGILANTKSLFNENSGSRIPDGCNHLEYTPLAFFVKFHMTKIDLQGLLLSTEDSYFIKMPNGTYFV